MDIASVIGILLGISLLLIAIAIAPGSSFGAFIDYPSLMVVVGGAICAVLISFPLKSFLGLAGIMKNVFFNKQANIAELIEPERRGHYSGDPAIRAAAQGTEIYPWADSSEG